MGDFGDKFDRRRALASLNPIDVGQVRPNSFREVLLGKSLGLSCLLEIASAPFLVTGVF